MAYWQIEVHICGNACIFSGEIIEIIATE